MLLPSYGVNFWVRCASGNVYAIGPKSDYVICGWPSKQNRNFSCWALFLVLLCAAHIERRVLNPETGGIPVIPVAMSRNIWRQSKMASDWDSAWEQEVENCKLTKIVEKKETGSRGDLKCIHLMPEDNPIPSRNVLEAAAGFFFTWVEALRRLIHSRFETGFQCFSFSEIQTEIEM